MRNAPLVRRGFTLGTKSSLDPSSVPPNALYKALNVHCDESGIVRIRGGSETFGTSLGAKPFQAARTSFEKILSVWNRNVYLHDTDGTRSQIGTGLVGATADNRASIIRWTRSGAEIAYLFGGNGIFETAGVTVTAITPYAPATGEKPNLIRKTDGTLETNSGPCRCRFTVLKASLSQRIAASGDPLSPNTVYLSAPLDGTYWSSDQIIQLPDDGSVITGLTNWYNALIIFRDRDIWAFFGTDVIAPGASLVLQDSSVGCPEGDTVCAVPNLGLVFCGPDNVYAMQGVTGVESQVKCVPIGFDIGKDLKKAISFGWKNVSAIYNDQQYIVCFPNCTEDFKEFRLSMKNGGMAWYTNSGPSVSKYLIFNEQLYGAYYNSGRFIKYNPATLVDEEQGIPIEIGFRREDLQPGPARVRKVYVYVLSKGRSMQTDLFFMGSSFNQKMVDAPDVDPVTINQGTPQTLKCSVTADGIVYTVEAFSVFVEQVNFSDLAKIEPVRAYEFRFDPSLKANFAQIEISGMIPGEDIAVLGYGIDSLPRGRIHALKTGVTK